MKVGHFLSSSDDFDEILERRCYFKKYYGATWRQVLEREPKYVMWLLYESDFELDSDLAEALELSLDEMHEI